MAKQDGRVRLHPRWLFITRKQRSVSPPLPPAHLPALYHSIKLSQHISEIFVFKLGLILHARLLTSLLVRYSIKLVAPAIAMPHVYEQQHVADHLDCVADEETDGCAWVVRGLGRDDDERAREVPPAICCAMVWREGC